MRFDFWNNPLVVSAIRVKNRNNGLFNAVTGYLALLGCACVAAWYLFPVFQGRPVPAGVRLHLILVGLLAFQMVLSFFMALNMTGAAMTSEVASGTLDYQRLTPMTPAQVLFGKLLGPPVTVYLMTLGSIPFTFGLWALGAANISFGTLLLLYLHLATTTLLGAALGLVKNLRSAPSQKDAESSGSGIGCLLLLLIGPALSGLAMVPMLLRMRETAALASLLVPLGPMAGLFEFHDPWHYALDLFGVSIPFLLLTPVAQISLGALCFFGMVRRFTNTAIPAVSKPMAYATLAVIDLLAAAVLFEAQPAAPELGPRSTGYWLCHCVAVLFLTAWITADRSLLRTWIWRFRGRRSRLRDLWCMDRSENVLALLTFCGIGVAIYVLLLALPAVLVSGWDKVQATDPAVVGSLLFACVVTISLGTFLQTCLFVAGGAGAWLLVLPMLLDLLVFSFGRHFNLTGLLELSVVAHCASWRGHLAPLSPLPILGLHGFFFLVSWMLLRRTLRREMIRVDRQLRRMGVLEAKPADTPPKAHDH